MTRQEIWETYARAWKAESADEKRELLSLAVQKECVYTDPLTQRNGWNDLINYMTEFQQLGQKF